MCPQKSWSNPRSQRFSPLFSSKGVIVLDFTFQPLIHFEFVCMCVGGYKIWIEGFFFAYGYPTGLVPVVKRDYPFSIELPWYLCQKSVVHLCVCLFLMPFV